MTSAIPAQTIRRLSAIAVVLGLAVFAVLAVTTFDGTSGAAVATHAVPRSRAALVPICIELALMVLATLATIRVVCRLEARFELWCSAALLCTSIGLQAIYVEQVTSRVVGVLIACELPGVLLVVGKALLREWLRRAAEADASELAARRAVDAQRRAIERQYNRAQSRAKREPRVQDEQIVLPQAATHEQVAAGLDEHPGAKPMTPTGGTADREAKVARAVAEGWTGKRLAEEIGVGEQRGRSLLAAAREGANAPAGRESAA